MDSKWAFIVFGLILDPFIKLWVQSETMSPFWTHRDLILDSFWTRFGLKNEPTSSCIMGPLHLDPFGLIFESKMSPRLSPKWVHGLTLDSFWTHYLTLRCSWILPLSLIMVKLNCTCKLYYYTTITETSINTFKSAHKH